MQISNVRSKADK